MCIRDRTAAELSTEQNENMIDGVLNNAPSLGELEAKAKAGEQISLTDLAAAVKAEEKAPKAKKSRAAKPKKPSIRAQPVSYTHLDVYKRQGHSWMPQKRSRANKRSHGKRQKNWRCKPCKNLKAWM